MQVGDSALAKARLVWACFLAGSYTVEFISFERSPHVNLDLYFWTLHCNC